MVAPLIPTGTPSDYIIIDGMTGGEECFDVRNAS